MKDYIKRDIKAPSQTFFLLGPRGTGKSTWVRREFPTAYCIDLLDEELYQGYLADISLFAAQISVLPPRSRVFIDEIQRLPALLNEVHRFIEKKRLCFILTGSSARKLKKSGQNLLGGRAIKKTMFPFMPSELGKEFDLNKILEQGSIPLVWKSETPKETLKAYVQIYLKEEIQAEALVRNLPGFARFLPIAALFHGQTLNISSLARDAGVARTTIAGYLEILEDTLLAFQLPAFTSRLRVREKKHPKLYWIDPGLVRAVKKSFGPTQPEESGALFEGWVATLLKFYQDHYDLYDDIYYWSPAEANQTEVDFLLKKQNKFVAIEVKNSKKFKREYARGMKSISELKGIVRKVIVYRGQKRLKLEDNMVRQGTQPNELPPGATKPCRSNSIEVWPVDYFIKVLKSGKLFS